MSNSRTPTPYDVRTIVEHAMRRLFQAQGRSWEEFGPDDAQRAEWIEQALVTPNAGLDDLTREQTSWRVPRRVDLKPVDADAAPKRLLSADLDRAIASAAE